MELIIVGLGALMGWSILFPGWVYHPPFGEFRTTTLPDPSAGEHTDSCRGKIPADYDFDETSRIIGTPTPPALRASTRILTDAEHAEAAAALRKVVKK
jgi:hypothetical protein